MDDLSPGVFQQSKEVNFEKKYIQNWFMHLREIKKVLMVEHASVHRQLNSLFKSELIHKI
jgi:predicted transcriptional regulator